LGSADRPTVATIRYYEEIGLLRPRRESGGQRTSTTNTFAGFLHPALPRFRFCDRGYSRAVVIAAQCKSCTEARKLAKAAGRAPPPARRTAGAGSNHHLAGHRLRNTCDGGPAPDCVILQAD